MSWLIVNYFKVFVKIVKNKVIISMLIFGCCLSDINLNFLIVFECGVELVYDEDDMILLYFLCLEDEEEEEWLVEEG